VRPGVPHRSPCPRPPSPPPCAPGFLIFPLLWALNLTVLQHSWRYTDWIYALTHVWLLYFYVSLSLRENILRVVRRPAGGWVGGWRVVRRPMGVWVGGVQSHRIDTSPRRCAEREQHPAVVDLPPLRVCRHERDRADVAHRVQVSHGQGGGCGCATITCGAMPELSCAHRHCACAHTQVVGALPAPVHRLLPVPGRGAVHAGEWEGWWERMSKILCVRHPCASGGCRRATRRRGTTRDVRWAR
jgi:hypothetical protein